MGFKSAKGFTLIEVIIGMVTLSIAFSVIINLLLPTAEQSAGQLQQIRAAELGQSLMNEILSKAFDHNSDMAGGELRCGEDEAPVCTAGTGSEVGETRATYNDVDDYNDISLENSIGEDLTSLYQGFSILVDVCNDSDYDGDCDTNANNYTAKLISITVTDPLSNSVAFSVYKANF